MPSNYRKLHRLFEAGLKAFDTMLQRDKVVYAPWDYIVRREDNRYGMCVAGMFYFHSLPMGTNYAMALKGFEVTDQLLILDHLRLGEIAEAHYLRYGKVLDEPQIDVRLFPAVAWREDSELILQRLRELKI